MGTITINVDDKVEERFRKNVAMKYGMRKGALGEAVAEALEHWNNEHADLEFTMRLLEQKKDRGGYRYMDRGELHARD
jgi:hypothetical protein